MNRINLVTLILIPLFLSACDKGLFFGNAAPGDDILDPSEKPLRLNTQDLDLTEGPVWNGEDSVFFRAGPKANIHAYSIKDSQISSLGPASNGIHGLMFSISGKLLACKPDEGKIVGFNSPGGMPEDVLLTYNGNTLNQPNDLVTDKSGGFYFTDPFFKKGSQSSQPVRGVYYVDASGQARLLVKDMIQPNGIILSENGKFLYVVDMQTDEFRKYPVINAGKLGEKTSFAKLRHKFRKSAAPDGLAVDRSGRVYVSTRTGVQVFNVKGEFLGEIAFPERTTNLTFYGENMNKLFVTGLNNVYSLSMKVKGIQFPAY